MGTCKFFVEISLLFIYFKAARSSGEAGGPLNSDEVGAMIKRDASGPIGIRIADQ